MNQLHTEVGTHAEMLPKAEMNGGRVCRARDCRAQLLLQTSETIVIPVGIAEQGLRAHRRNHYLCGLLQLEQPRAGGHGDAHNDGLADAVYVVLAAVQGGIEQVVSGLLKGSQHEHALLHA